MKLFDTHSHYNDEKFDNDREEIIKNTYLEGVTKFTVVGYDLNSSKQAVYIANKYQYIYAICGISPNDVNNINEVEEIYNISKNNKVVAIGEIGLDYYWNKENKDNQREFFIKQIDIANKLNKPIVIHTREAVNDTIEILKNNEVKKTGIFHCCPLNRELIKQALKLGFMISFAGPVTFKNSKNADEVINMVPLEKILIETDSPYLAPEPKRGTRNDSRNVKYIAEKIAKVKGLELEEVAKITYDNALRIFEIK